MRDLAFLAAWLVLFPLSFGGAQVALLLWAWTSLLGPSDLMFGLAAAVPFAKLAAIPAALQLLFRRDSAVRPAFGRSEALLLGLAACALLSQSVTVMADQAPGWDLCVQFLKVLALGLVVPWIVTDRLRVHALLMAICLGIGYIAVDEGAKCILSGSAHKVLGSPSLGDNNQVALDVLLILPMLLYLQATAASWSLRLACLGTGALGVVTVVATYSRGGFLGLVVVGVASAASSRRRGRAAVLLLAALALGGALVGPDWVARMNSVQDAGGDNSFMGRVIAWKVSTALALDRPLLGGGFHAIQHAEVWQSEARTVAMLDLPRTDPPGETPRAAHSIYFEVLGDLGFAGLALLVLLLAGAWRDASTVLRLVRRSGRADLIWAAALAAQLRVSLLALLVSGALLSAAYRDIDYLIVGLLAALRLIVRRALAEPSTVQVHDPGARGRPQIAGVAPALPRGRRLTSTPT